MIRSFWESLAAFLISGVGVGGVLFYLRRTGLVDVPNRRSSHSVPTPRGGGIALVGSVLLTTAYDVAHADVAPRLVVALGYASVALLLLIVVGWLDDHRAVWLNDHRLMSIILRLPLHLVCGVAVAVVVNRLAPLPGMVNILWLAWWVVWTAASINIVNFMDGIDGMVASQGAAYGFFLFALVAGDLKGSSFGLILAGACLGFLVWNWAPARIFMGDVGSGPLGLLFVIGGALALQDSAAELVFLPLFPLYFDALATLVFRFRTGERVLHPHRDHLYQRVANSGVGHAIVSATYVVAAAVGAIIALTIRDASPPVRVASILVYCIAMVFAWMVVHTRFPSLARYVDRVD